MRLNSSLTVGQQRPEPTAIERVLQRAQFTVFERSTFLPLSEEDRAQLIDAITAAKGQYLVAAQNPLLPDMARCTAQKVLEYMDQIVLPGVRGARDDFEATLAIKPFSTLNTFPSVRRSTFGPLCDPARSLASHKEFYIERLSTILSDVEDELNEPGRGKIARCSINGLLAYAHSKIIPAIEGAATDIAALGPFLTFTAAHGLIGNRVLAVCREEACEVKARIAALIAGGSVLGLGIISCLVFRR